jgi:hypothetical protein
VLDADFNDLRISYLNDVLTVKSVIDHINLNHEESEARMILSYLDAIIPFGINDPE